MRKRVLAGLLSVVMLLQTSVMAQAAETDLAGLPYKGKIEGQFVMDSEGEETEEGTMVYQEGDETEALYASDYSVILPSAETIDKYACRGDVMKLRFNLFCRGVSTDKYYVQVRKGSTKSGGKTGKIVGHSSGNFDAEECLINMTLEMDTKTMEAGTYTVESYMKYKYALLF